jgi:hypothetical protein
MMKRWGEQHSKSTAATSAVLSMAVHAALIGAAVIVTTDPHIELREIPESSFARFLAPPNRAGGQTAQPEMLKFVALAAPASNELGTRPRVTDVQRLEPERVSGLMQQTAEARPEIVGIDSVFTILEVDSAASRYEWSAAPAYPAAMLELKREGYVKARWVVDEAGYADTTSLKFVDYTAQEFAKAVRDALPFMRFSPAKVGAKPVRQLVEQEFNFRIATVTSTPVVTKKPES